MSGDWGRGWTFTSVRCGAEFIAFAIICCGSSGALSDSSCLLSAPMVELEFMPANPAPLLILAPGGSLKN